MSRLWAPQDARVALRALARAPGTALGAVLCMAVGLGAASAVFSFVHATVLQPLPFPNAGRIVDIEAIGPEDLVAGEALGHGAYDPHYLRWTEQTRQFEAFALYSWWPARLVLPDARHPARGLTVSARFFDVLGIKPLLGRFFEPGRDTQKDAGRVVVLGYGVWQKQFGADEAILGEEVQLGDRRYTVIGVAPPDIRFVPSDVGRNLGGLSYEDSLDFFVPLYRALEPDPAGHATPEWDCIARMKPHVSVGQAERELRALAEPLARGFVTRASALADADDEAASPAELMGVLHDLPPVRVRPLHAIVHADTVALLRPMSVAVGLLLLIACVNVACLLLARGVRAERESAIRAVLGARRWQLMPVLVMQSVAVCLVGSLVGLLVAFAAVHAILPFAPGDIPGLDRVTVGPSTFAFCLLAALAAGILMALVPAWRASRPDCASLLTTGPRVSDRRGHPRPLLRVLVVAEIAVTVTLLVLGGLLLHSYIHLARAELGFDADAVLTLRVDSEGRPESYAPMVEEVRALPGVVHAGMAYGSPFLGEATGFEWAHRGEKIAVTYRFAGPGYFEALGVPVVAGRAFSDADAHIGAGDDVPVVLNRRYATARLPEGSSDVGDVVGTLYQPGHRVVGVVEDFRAADPAEPPAAQAYAIYTTPYSLHHPHRMVVRTRGEPDAVRAAVTAAVRVVDPMAVVDEVRTLESVRADVTAGRRFALSSVAAFALAGLVLAGAGLYGVMTFATLRRAQEVSIRVACGAGPWRVLGLVGRGGVVVSLLGTGLGLAGALAASRFVELDLYRVSPWDPATYVAVFVVVAVTVVVAAMLPAWRLAWERSVSRTPGE